MSAEEIGMDTLTPRDGLAAQLRQLEAFVARSESDGDALPPEAVEMVARLREIMHALEGLTSSFEGLNAVPPHDPVVAAEEEKPGTQETS